MNENTGKLRTTIIRIKRTIDEVESEDTEEPADSLILEIPKKRPRRFKNLSLNDKEEKEKEEEKEEEKKDDEPKKEDGKEGEGVLERRVFKFVGSSREGNVENPLSLEDFKKVRSVLRKTMQAKAAEGAAKAEQQTKRRTKQSADRSVNARVSFVSAKKSARILDLTEGSGSDVSDAKRGEATEVVTCNGIPMKVTKRKKTVYDIYYCYERVKAKKDDTKAKHLKKGVEDDDDNDDDDDDDDDDDVEYEEATDSEDDMNDGNSDDKALYEEAKRFRIDSYDSDLFFGNLDEYAVDEEEIGNDYDYDSNAEDNSSNTYPDEDDFDSDSDGDPFGFDEDEDDDDDGDSDSDSDDNSYRRRNNYDRNSSLKKKFASDMFKIFGSSYNKRNSAKHTDDDDDEDMMDFDDDDDDRYDNNQYSKYAYDDYDDYNDDDDDDNYF